MRNGIIGLVIAALALVGCGIVDGDSRGPKGPTVIGYAKTTVTSSDIPACRLDSENLDTAKLSRIRNIYPIAITPSDSATFCIYALEIPPEGKAIREGMKQRKPLIDLGDKCFSVEQPKKDTISIDGNEVIVDVVQDPCINFYYYRDLLKE